MSAPSERGAVVEAGMLAPVALVAVVLGLLVSWGARDFALDDAWIHLSYVRSLRLGDGWSYNPGDHEAGCSSPLWVVLLWAWPTTGDPVPRVLALGVLLHALTAWCAGALALAIGRRQASKASPLPLRSIAALAGTLAASSPLHLQGIGSGMEVPLASALALAIAWAIVEARVGAAAVLGALGLLARPELGAWSCAWLAAVMLAGPRTAVMRRAALAAVGGTAAAALGWCTWLLATVGTPLPNAWYVKGRGGGIAGLGYLAAEVLPWLPWLVGLGGAALVVAAVRRELQLRLAHTTVLVGVTIATSVMLALSRPLHEGVQFFEARYFVPLLTAMPVVVALGLAALPRWASVAALVPVAALAGVQARDALARSEQAAEDTRVLHTQPAHFVAAELPPTAIVAVEGAGAQRYFTPRTMTIVDLVGLNDHRSAALHNDRRAKTCHWIARAPTHAVVPMEWVPMLGEVFELAPLAVFDDPAYTQVEPARPLRVVVVALGQLRPAWRDCATQ
jgi:hypothetical protein